MSQTNFRVIDEPVYFSDAHDAQEYAKNNPGCTITRTGASDNPIMDYTPSLYYSI